MTGADSNGHDRPRRARRRLVISLIAVVVSLAGFLALAIGFRKPIAASLLVGELDRLTGGSGNNAVTVTRLDRDHLALRELRIGEALFIDRLEARYSPTGLFASRLDEVRVVGLRLHGSLDASGVSFGSLDALLDAPSSGESNGAVSLPTARLEMDDARISLVTPEGPLVVSVDSRISQKSPGRFEAAIELDLEHRLATWNAALTASGDGDEWSGQISLDAAMSGDFGPSVHIGDFTLAARPTFTVEPEHVTIRAEECVEFSIARFEIADGPRITRAFELCVQAESISIGRDGASVVDLVASIGPFSFDIGDGLEISGDLPAVILQGGQTSDGALTGSLSAERLDLELPLRIGVRGIQLEVSATPSRAAAQSSGSPPAKPPATLQTAKAELRIDSLFDSQLPARFNELNLHANLVSADASAAAAVAFDLEIADAGRNAVVEIAGQHESTLGVGHASLQLRPFAFCPSGPELTSVLPMLSEVVNQAQGSVEAKGRLDWDETGTRAEIDVALRDFSATISAFDIEHMYAAVTLLESGTPPGQLLSIGRIGFGLELTGGEVLFQILPEGQIAIESAVWSFAGGELSTAGQIDPFADQQKLTFDVQGVDLAALLELVALEGLSGSGALEGRLPLDRDGDRVEIRGASLHSGPDGGTIRYQPEPGAASLAAVDDQLGVLMSVLENFHYTHLSLAIDGDAAAEVVVEIRLEGSNPDYKGGQAVHFNLSIDSRLSDLISDESTAYQIPYLIEERFGAFSEPEVNLSASPCVHPPESLDDGAAQR